MSLTNFVTAKIREATAADLGESVESPEILAALEQFAAAALEGGVRHTWKDWLSFSDLERRAWVSAGRMLRGHNPASMTLDEHDARVADQFAKQLALEVSRGP